MWPEDATFPVYDNEEWYATEWDGCSTGRAFDPSQPFFTQFARLRDATPHYARSALELENCDYCNNIGWCKNCYLIFDADYNEDCFYSESLVRSKDCIDCTNVFDSELCYDCVQCQDSYRLQSSTECSNCSNSAFLFNCRGCADCFCCVNLRHKQYCIFNEQFSKEDYFKERSKYQLGSFSQRQKIAQQAIEFFRTQPRPHVIQVNVEDVSGEGIYDSKQVHDSFYVQGGRDIRFGYRLKKHTNDCYDFSAFGLNAELIYEAVHCGIDSQRLLFCHLCWGNCSNLTYCINCVSCENCFGCVGLYRKQFCILNKQFTESEYNVRVASIVAEMEQSKEWGEFFPMQLSGTSYNHSTAFRHFPLSSEEAKQRGLKWHDRETIPDGNAISADSLPDVLPEKLESIVVRCAQTEKRFRITSREIELSRKLNIPLPHMRYDVRMLERAKRLGDVRVYSRKCASTGREIHSHIPPDSPWVVWDREEFLGEFDS